MGVLADIFSTGNTLKRRLNKLIQDPLGEIGAGVARFGEDQNALINLMRNAYPMAGERTVLNSPEQIAGFQRELADKGTDQAMAGMTASKFVYPQDKALETARINAAKPVSEGGLGLPANNTPMDRARAMGFDTDFYHGQSQPQPKKEYIEGLGSVVVEQPELKAISALKNGGGNAEGGAFFGVNDPFVANGYAQNGAVYPMKTVGSTLRESGVTGENIDAFNRTLDKNKSRYFNSEIKQSNSEGFGGTVFRNIEDSAGQKLYDIPADIFAITKSPTRSRFAAFDPARRNEADILGRVDNKLLQILAGAGLLGAAGYSKLQDK